MIGAVRVAGRWDEDDPVDSPAAARHQRATATRPGPAGLPTALGGALERGRANPEEIADLLGVSARQVGQWFRIFRNKGPDRLGTRTTRAIRANLGPAQVERLKQEVATGTFHNAEQVRTWVRDT